MIIIGLIICFIANDDLQHNLHQLINKDLMLYNDLIDEIVLELNSSISTLTSLQDIDLSSCTEIDINTYQSLLINLVTTLTISFRCIKSIKYTTYSICIY